MTSMPVPFVKATQPPKPNGVGVAMPSITTFRSLRGILTFKTPSLKSPCRPRVVNTAEYSSGILCWENAGTEITRLKQRISQWFDFMVVLPLLLSISVYRHRSEFSGCSSYKVQLQFL